MKKSNSKYAKAPMILQRNPRRDFLKNMCCASLMGAGMGAMNGKLGMIGSALAASDTRDFNDYRALVCVFLYGGSDSFNMFVPTDELAYARYAASRGSLLAVPKESLLLPTENVGIGFNEHLPRTKGLFDAGNLAVVSNVGNLIKPINKQAYLSSSSDIPVDLFAHNHQQEQWLKGFSSEPSSIVATGWGGRMADMLQEANSNQSLPPTFSVAGSNHWLPGNASTPISLNPNTGLDSITFMNNKTSAANSTRAQVLSDILSMDYQNRLHQQTAETMSRSINSADGIIDALTASSNLSSPYDASSKLASQLRMVARLIAGRESLGMQRQIFFVGMGGWDTHDNQTVQFNSLLTELDNSLADFNQTLADLGQENAVTTFTASDFGRTLTVNGDGSDHGWGGHYMVMGGAVSGNRMYGQLPSFETGAEDDAGDKGRVIPKVSVNQMGASLGSWMGLSNSDLLEIFPDLINFGSDWHSGLEFFS